MNNRFKSTALCRRLLRRLVTEHGLKFDRPIEDYWIARMQDNITAGPKHGMDYVTWKIYANRMGPLLPTECSIEGPHVWHPYWNRPGNECGFVECTIDSADPISELVRRPFIVQVTYKHIELG